MTSKAMIHFLLAFHSYYYRQKHTKNLEDNGGGR